MVVSCCILFRGRGDRLLCVLVCSCIVVSVLVMVLRVI